MRYVIITLLGVMTLVLKAQTGQEEIAIFSAERVMKYKSKINLTDQQSEAVKKIYNEETASFNALKWDLDDANLKLSELLSQTKVDSEAAMVQMEKVLALESQIKQKRLAVFLSVKNLLTQDQQTKLIGMNADETVTLSGQAIDVKVKNKGGNGNPLYIIEENGKTREVDDVSQIDPKDIDSIEVIKGESAMDRFKEKGRNGVVIIKLKG